MKNTNHIFTQDFLDNKIDSLLKADSKFAPTNLADKVLKSISVEAESVKYRNAVSDSLLSRMIDYSQTRLADRVIAEIHVMKTSFSRQVLAYVAAAAVAACATFAVYHGTSASLTKKTQSNDAFAKMSKISDEINSIDNLVVQEEFFDFMRL